MLEFLLGTNENAKTDEIYRRASADALNQTSAFILVPEQYSMCAEHELISRLGLSAQNKIQILTFSRLVNMLFSKLGPLRTKYIDKAGKYLLACRSLQLCRKDLKFFGKNINQPGFGSLIVSLISEFKRYGVSPDDLKKQAENVPDGILSAKLSDLSVIYNKFNTLVEENWLNAEDNLSLALPKIQKADFLNGNLYINYFRSFTPVEYAAIKELMQKMNICISLCASSLSESSSVFSSQVLVHKNLCSMAFDAGISVEKPIFFEDVESCDISHEILHLKKNYFAESPKALLGMPKDVHIARPQNYYAEVEYAARLISRLCRTKGYCLNDFLVLCGSLENYEIILPAIFEKFDISFFLDQKTALAESPFMRMIFSILEILAFGFSYERIMEILRSGFWDIQDSEADLFENYIIAADITHKNWRTAEDWTFNPCPERFDMSMINQIKKKVVTPLHDLLGLFGGRKNIGDIAIRFCNWLNESKMPTQVSSKINQLKTDCNFEAADRLLGVWNSFVSLINQISDCMANTPATFGEFYELFSSCVTELSTGTIPPTQDKVTISETQRFRTTGAKVIIVLGVLDKSFPKSHIAEGILSDAERLMLREYGTELAPDSYSRQKEEQFLIYSVFGSAKNELYLSSPLSDREGKSLGKSEVIRRIKTAIFPDIALTDETELDLIEGKDHTFFELCAKLFECDFDEKRLPPLWQSVYSCFKDDADYSSRLKHFSEMSLRSTEPAAISKALAKKLYGSPLSLSVSKLEKYNSCAFSFFMRYGLLAEERLLGGLKATDTGTILHDVLCKYFEQKSKTDCNYSAISRDDCFDEIAVLVNDFARNSDNAMFTDSSYYKYMLMRLKNIAGSTAWKLVKFYSQSKFRPSGFEVSFGGCGNLPAYKLSTKDGDVFLKGFIDRTDTAEINGQKYVAITDYKSSEKRLDQSLMDAGVTLQPLIYANALSNADKDLKTAALMYFQMNDPILKFEGTPTESEWESEFSNNIKVHGLFLDKADVLDALDANLDDKNAVHYINCDKKSRLVQELFEKKLADAENCAAHTAENISDGLIDANPPAISGFDPCEYCPYGSVCGQE